MKVVKLVVTNGKSALHFISLTHYWVQIILHTVTPTNHSHQQLLITCTNKIFVYTANT